MSKKKLLSLSLVVIMIAVLSLNTLAWFSDSDEVTNDILIAGSDDADPDAVFSVDVWENTPDGEKDQDGYTYKNILPGDLLKKEVYVENTGAYDQYIRVIVVVSDARQWAAVLKLDEGAVPALSQLVSGLNNDKWTPNSANYDETNNTFWYVLYGTNILKVDADTSVFTGVKIPTSMTQEQGATFEGGFKIKVLAQAVQTRNVGDTCQKAFQTVGLDATAAYDSIIAAWENP